MKIALIFLLAVTSFTSIAGPGGGHSHGHGHSHSSIAKNKTESIGRVQIDRLIKSGKINKSWKESQFDKTIKKKFSGKPEWVVTFKNEKGVKGKTLYIFLKESGAFVAANFSGK